MHGAILILLECLWDVGVRSLIWQFYLGRHFLFSSITQVQVDLLCLLSLAASPRLGFRIIAGVLTQGGFPGGSDSKSICLQCRRPRFAPWFRKIPWRRKWQPTPVVLPGKSHGWRSLVGYSPQDHKESEATQLHFHFHFFTFNTRGFTHREKTNNKVVSSYLTFTAT